MKTEHLRDHGLHAASDSIVLQRAREHDQILISADTDFGTLLASTGADKPSVILIRRSSARRASELATLLLSYLDAITDDLMSGAVVVVTDTDLRVRELPIPPRATKRLRRTSRTSVIVSSVSSRRIRHRIRENYLHFVNAPAPPTRPRLRAGASRPSSPGPARTRLGHESLTT